MLDDDPLWYKDAIIYELHVRAFQDSDGDGIGDFRGLTARLDYLQDLGVTAIWLLPFYPSPLKDDGYDIADYTDVHPSYGTLRDVEVFLDEAHRRGLRVITELVLNHTSDQHPWFRRARRAPAGSVERDFYVWSESPAQGQDPGRYAEARVIFQDFEPSNWAWDRVAGAYYWHRFFSHQPDLNYDNPAVREALLPVVDFWLGRGVDGLRLDAVPYLFEREGTSCENLPETYEFLKALRRHVDSKFPNRMLLAEANQWPEDAAAYFADGQACHMAFHFPLMPRMFMAIQMEDRFPIVDILAQTPPICASCQWATFLRNHDELTLEMVTDEERDYMNRVYARDRQARINLGIRRRLAPLMGNHRRRIELMNALLFSLPGTPVLYYGDEIGMGDNIYLGDRNGVRTPMQWGPDRNAGFSRANPQRLYLPAIIDPEYHYETVNVESQQDNPHSLLRWTNRLIAQRKRYKAFGRGSLEFLHPANPKVLVYVRRYEGEQILVAANLSRFVQHAELDLSAFRGMVPVELFGRIEFPPIGERPYFLTFGPHAFYWFALESRREGLAAGRDEAEGELPAIAVSDGWEEVFRVARARSALEGALRAHLIRRQFGGDERRARFAEVREAVPVPGSTPPAYLVLLHVEPFEGEPGTYQIPLAFAPEGEAPRVLDRLPRSGVARLRGDRGGLLYDPLGEPGFCAALLDAIAGGATVAGESGLLLATSTRALAERLGPAGAEPEPRLLDVEQSNSAVALGDRLFLKLFRRIDAGINPDLEVGRFLTGRGFAHVPPVAGALEYRRGQAEPMTLAILQGFVPNQGDAWGLTLDAVGRYYEEVLSIPPTPDLAAPRGTLLEMAEMGPPPLAAEAIGAYLESARLMGRRTAEMHRALASGPDDPDFAPEPFTTLYQRSLYQSMRGGAGRVLRLLHRRRDRLPEAARDEVEAVLARRDEVLARPRALLARKMTATRIRCHGDYHLGQLLHTGKDFVIIDFEGEAYRVLSERRHKRSPLRDVAGLLRSFHYASHAAWSGQVVGRRSSPGLVRGEDVARLEPWARFWNDWVGAAFLGAYLAEAAGASFLPRDRDDLGVLLDSHLLDCAVDSLGHELEHRPDWAWISLRLILRRLGEPG
jgi:maltose alpha-D-glucosyltransferase / alpha-amylase